MGAVWNGIVDKYFPEISAGRRREQFQGLIGTPDAMVHPDQPLQGGTGLLGNQMNFPEFAARTAQLGGQFRQPGLDMLYGNYARGENQTIDQQAQVAQNLYEQNKGESYMDRKKRELKEKWELKKTEASNIFTRKENEKTRKATLDERRIARGQKFGELYDANTKKMTSNLNTLSNIQQSLQEKQRLTGDMFDHKDSQLDNVMITSLNQFLKENEAVNAGDVGWIVESSGISREAINTLKSLKAGEGQGVLARGDRIKIAQLLNMFGQTTMGRMQEMQDTGSRRMQNLDVPGSVSSNIYSPVPKIPRIPTAGLLNMTPATDPEDPDPNNWKSQGNRIQPGDPGYNDWKSIPNSFPRIN